MDLQFEMDEPSIKGIAPSEDLIPLVGEPVKSCGPSLVGLIVGPIMMSEDHLYILVRIDLDLEIKVRQHSVAPPWLL